MPVRLPPAPETPPTAPPNLLIWFAVCVVVMAAASAYTLFTWPKDVPTGTAWFWVRLIGFPGVGCTLLFGLRQLYFERGIERLRVERDRWKQDCAEATRFAQEPLALLSCGYLCSLGTFDVARTLLDDGEKLESRTPVVGAETIRHTALYLVDDPLLPDRYASCFRELLAAIDDSLRALSGSVPFEVHLDCGGNIEPSELLAIWQICWAQTGHRSVEASILQREEGVMALDAWLDAYGGPALEKYALFVSVQLHEVPPANSAEAAAALLLAWAPTACRNGLPIRALIHRPVETSHETLGEALSTALLWGQTRAEELFDVWQTGLAPADKPALIDVSSHLAWGASDTDDLSGFHDIDLAIGHAGVADAWLAVAFAAERAVQTGKPQAVVTRQRDLRVGVIRPLLVEEEDEAHASTEIQ